MDISSLIREEILTLEGFSNAVESLLNYRFAKALKKNQVNLRFIINWFENQVVDKGWNAGFSRYYPEVPRIGYKGYITSDLYLCTLPSKCENINNVLPHEIAVIGKELCVSTREFDSTLRTKVVPAFRFAHLWEEGIFNPDPEYYTIFFALPYSRVESKEIFNALCDNLDYMISKNIRIIMKPHPTMSLEYVESLIDSNNSNVFSLVDESFIDCLSKSNLLISGMSGAIIESIVFGIPVIIMRNRKGITFNPIPNEIPPGIWTMCDFSNEIIDSIQRYNSMSDEQVNHFKYLGKQVRANYYEPVTRQGVLDFLGLNNT